MIKQQDLSLDPLKERKAKWKTKRLEKNLQPISLLTKYSITSR